MTKLAAKDLIAYTTSELETLCALIMDTIMERQGDVVPDSMEAFSNGLVCPHCGSIRCVKNGSVRGKALRVSRLREEFRSQSQFGIQVLQSVFQDMESLYQVHDRGKNVGSVR